jgi:hypothetical protein
MKKVQSGEKTLKQAVDEYDSNVQERGAKEVQISKSQTFFTHDWEAFKVRHVQAPVSAISIYSRYSSHPGFDPRPPDAIIG